MTDRELLEQAAKAAGVGPVLCYESNRNCLRIGDRKSYTLWRPLTDDGDALRLAVRCGIGVFLKRQCSPHEAQALLAPSGFLIRETVKEDECAATRRAIVTAAEIGTTMQKRGEA